VAVYHRLKGIAIRLPQSEIVALDSIEDERQPELPPVSTGQLA